MSSHSGTEKDYNEREKRYNDDNIDKNSGNEEEALINNK